MKAIYRRYRGEEDYWRMREFLRRVFVANNSTQMSWHVARLDYARWHGCLNCAGVSLDDVVHIWEAGPQIVAVVMPDGGFGEAHLLVHPEADSTELEQEMIGVAMQLLPEKRADGSRRLYVWSPARNQLRRDLLLRAGFDKANAECQWRKPLHTPIQEVAVPSGYTIRSLGEGVELLERCYASGLAFHHGDLRVAIQNRSDPSWYHHIQTAPLYRRDLDLVAVSRTGAVAAFCTVWFDDVTRTGLFEPVGTVPEHQRRGLAKALLAEGLVRLKRIGATMAFVSGGSDGANALYESVMGSDCEVYESWLRTWKLP